jgi:hypothetical protein
VLALPSLEKPFHLFVTVDKGIASGVLTQNHGRQKPVAYLSKILDLVSKEWPECIQSVAASAGSRKLTCRGILIVSTPHQVRTILNQKVGRWLTDSKILKYEATLLERDDLKLNSDDCLNPVEFLVGGQSSSPIEHLSRPDRIPGQGETRLMRRLHLRPVINSLWLILPR